ncbi:folate-binding protein [Corynebacterium propinquum]|uniref:CAF17-like 4Fe-4S cluster assembly/insertion protein YgfZ n=1 Tax=Corynebacterium propinquum TaxID=43769 RepID=UPI0026706032|nr:folate-binding protein [Corynebacterium propinquum]WKS33137.1 folate-binding protein [Corynebacterium propinquum]WKS37503.1 folate-binding protein [Corynebacterium propinquum]WKS39589.1 folate-binding protein [Corynebacterium propinquum]WKS43940.1 folate-binding protein [Corynebacterium propinquum]WKS48229.1 folate-binding protein [Corynebacterium propinquum]
MAYQEDPPHPDVTGVAWHYGEPLSEQRAIESTGAIVDRSHRRVLKVSGPEAAAFLHNLLSQKLDDVSAGWSGSALDLDTQGRILHTMDIAVTTETEAQAATDTDSAEPAETDKSAGSAGLVFYLDCEASQFDSLRDFLQKMIFWSQVTIEEADLAIITVLGGPENIELPSQTLYSRTVSTKNSGYAGLGSTTSTQPTTGLWETNRTDIAVPREQLEAAVEELENAGLQLIGLMAYTAERVKALEPEAIDLDEKSIPHEIPHWIGRGERIGAVHLEKGCYRGQETVARVENLGRSPRLVVLLHLDGSAPTMPSPGAEIQAKGRRVGTLGTVIDDCDYGPIALGIVKRSALDAGQVNIGDVAASIDAESIPVEEGEKAGRAAINKLRGR